MSCQLQTSNEQQREDVLNRSEQKKNSPDGRSLKQSANNTTTATKPPLRHSRMCVYSIVVWVFSLVGFMQRQSKLHTHTHPHATTQLQSKAARVSWVGKKLFLLYIYIHTAYIPNIHIERAQQNLVVVPYAAEEEFREISWEIKLDSPLTNHHYAKK